MEEIMATEASVLNILQFFSLFFIVAERILLNRLRSTLSISEIMIGINATYIMPPAQVSYLTLSSNFLLDWAAFAE